MFDHFVGLALKGLRLFFMRRNFSLFTRCSLEFTRCLLLVANSLIARYSLPNSFVARYSLLMDWLLITRCKFACWLLLVANSLVELFAKANQKKKKGKKERKKQWKLSQVNMLFRNLLLKEDYLCLTQQYVSG